MKRKEYQNKVEEFINFGDNFKELKKDPGPAYATELRRLVNSEVDTFKGLMDNKPLIPMNSKTPLLYGMLKIHKDNMPIRRLLVL